MSLAIIELNDSEIRTAQGTEIVSRHPGYAVLTQDSIETGLEAWKIARSNPRQTTNRYWSQLSQDSLIIPSRLARHNADLAYAQLVAIHEHAGKPDEIIFAVPGSYTREQLALLLGIVEACPFSAIGLVDSAIAGTAAIAEPGQYHHLDIHLHYAVATSIDVTDQVSRKAVKVIDNVGISEIYDASAEIISDLFIDQTRFDPLHHAETEQSLYNQIPQSLAELKTADESTLDIHYKGKHYQARVPAEMILERLRQHYEKIYRETAGAEFCLISDRLDTLPGFSDQLDNIIAMDESSVFKGCHINIENIRSNGPALNFITTLPAANAPPQPAAKKKLPAKEATTIRPSPKTPPTHILVGSQAHPLGSKPLYIGANSVVQSKKADSSHCSITPLNGTVCVQAESDLSVYINGSRINGREVVVSGDTITIPGSETTIKCIEVLSS